MNNRKISVLGLGYVGLPLAIAFKNCIAYDIDAIRIEQLKNKIDKNKEVSSQDFIDTTIIFTNDIIDIAWADFHIVTVPTPLDKNQIPDLSNVKQATASLARIIKKGDIVVYESTVYPGVTEDICIPILETISKLKCGMDFNVGYSPERVSPGGTMPVFTEIVKVVAAQNIATLTIISQVYTTIVKAGVYQAPSIKIAEASKLIENIQRDINIALINELAIIFDKMHLDTEQIIKSATTKWNFMPFKPGLVGGHCISIDPTYLSFRSEELGYSPKLILAAREVNDNMPQYIVNRSIKSLIKTGHNMQNFTVIVLGITFKENCTDIRDNRTINVIQALKEYTNQIFVHDPIADSTEVYNKYDINLTSWDNLPQANLLIIVVKHNIYKNIIVEDKLKPGAVIFDVKSILAKEQLIAKGYTINQL